MSDLPLTDTPMVAFPEPCWLPSETSPLPETPRLEIANDTMESTHQECKSPTHVIKEWPPFCEEELKPKQELEFAILEECEKFYKSSAHHVGFSVHKSSFKKGKEGLQNYRYFVCSKQGFKRAQTNVNSRCSQIVHEDKLISNNWLGFLDCMQIVGRDSEKLTLIGKRIQYVLKELKELDGDVSESKISKLIFSHQNNVIPKEAVSVLKEVKKNQWNNNKKDGDFVKLMGNKATMTVVIVLQNFLPNLSLVEEELSKLQNLALDNASTLVSPSRSISSQICLGMAVAVQNGYKVHLNKSKPFNNEENREVPLIFCSLCGILCALTQMLYRLS
ncbi:hypothetical protein Cgig2_000400 [Carnegiea gigantea]|uniref:FAR1 domain-containing protein n=1 Tax=Carnegiea gigantea TaxID=171969 RepID=A0A9Q1K5V0_9CARY|nr:hypothetical protein Cgig2_000400 [Carnegiea gigantea]